MGALGSAFILAGLATGVDPTLLSSLCYVESNHKINAYRAQDGGSPSYGICQVKLGTAQALGFTGQAGGLMEVETNAYYAALYLKRQFKRYGSWEKAVSAYNCGHACGNSRYVQKVMGGHRELRSRQLLQMYTGNK